MIVVSIKLANKCKALKFRARHIDKCLFTITYRYKMTIYITVNSYSAGFHLIPTAGLPNPISSPFSWPQLTFPGPSLGFTVLDRDFQAHATLVFLASAPSQPPRGGSSTPCTDILSGALSDMGRWPQLGTGTEFSRVPCNNLSLTSFKSRSGGLASLPEALGAVG